MRIPALLLLCLATVSASAALSPQLAEWGDGPAQWIMTSDERKEWRKLTTDADATKFIDEFWARRAPAYKTEFESRVKIADESWGEKRKRGAMTDRGRVYIVLGMPSNSGGGFAQSQAQLGVSLGGGDLGGNRQRAARETWIWEYADAQKFEMSRIEVVFFEDPNTRRVQRDPRRGDFSLASAVAIRKSLEVPSAARAVPSTPASPSVATPAPTPVPTPAAPVDVAPVIASNTPGVSRLMLLKGGPLDPRSMTDPFPPKSEMSFSGQREIPFALQVCAAKAELPKLKYLLLISGPLEGASKDQRTREKDATLDRLAAKPGCYALQSTVPVSHLTPGRYKVSVLLEEPATSDTWSVKAEFRLE
ncbi:MAG TPA: GWxTD domain-containing protein [Thermoanaerobaculia bacterium]|nr:GWxTD domain-containing protein [Thermoanaerobaculia bacterium]